MIISTRHLWGPVLIARRPHGPRILALWGPLKYVTMPMAALSSIYTLSLGAGPSIYTPPEGVSLRDSRVFLVAKYKERGGLGGIAPWLIPPIPPGLFTLRTQAPWPTDPRPLGSADLLRCAHGPPQQHLYITIGAPYLMYAGPWPRAA